MNKPAAKYFSLQISLDPRTVESFYAMNLIDQEIVTEDCRLFMVAKMEALQTISSNANPGPMLFDRNGGVQRGPESSDSDNEHYLLGNLGKYEEIAEPVEPHIKQLLKSYTPKQKPSVIPFCLKPGRHSTS